MAASSDSPRLQSSVISPQNSQLSNGMNAVTPHPSRGKVRAAASKLKYKLGFKSHKRHNETQPAVASTSAAVEFKASSE